MIKNRVVLIGPMGAGKSTLGRLAAAALNWPYFDNDLEMGARFEKSQADLAALPVQELHLLEGRYLAEILAEPAPFIAGAAASVIDYPASVNLLKDATSIYLRIPLSTILERAGSEGVGRQALKESGEQILIERFNRRDPMYKSIAALTLELSDNPVADAAALVEFIKA